jgi:hypothetical protein
VQQFRLTDSYHPPRQTAGMQAVSKIPRDVMLKNAKLQGSYFRTIHVLGRVVYRNTRGT